MVGGSEHPIQTDLNSYDTGHSKMSIMKETRNGD